MQEKTKPKNRKPSLIPNPEVQDSQEQDLGLAIHDPGKCA
jgi:hypothetical protein